VRGRESTFDHAIVPPFASIWIRPIVVAFCFRSRGEIVCDRTRRSNPRIDVRPLRKPLYCFRSDRAKPRPIIEMNADPRARQQTSTSPLPSSITRPMGVTDRRSDQHATAYRVRCSVHASPRPESPAATLAVSPPIDRGEFCPPHDAAHHRADLDAGADPPSGHADRHTVACAPHRRLDRNPCCAVRIPSSVRSERRDGGAPLSEQGVGALGADPRRRPERGARTECWRDPPT
jgi:hypothetical protein